MSIKLERIESNLVKEISYILQNEVKNQDIKFVTITDVEVSSDLSYAKVYYTVLDDTKKDITKVALKNAAGFIRKELMDRVEMRYTPELDFKYDDSIEYGKNIEKIIEKIHEDDIENK